jgi:hypothetical protein
MAMIGLSLISKAVAAPYSCLDRSHSALERESGRGSSSVCGDSRKGLYFSNMTPYSTAGAAMRLVIGLFTCAVLATAAAGIGIAAWTGHLGHHDANLRTIHYDTNYDLSAQRRVPAE